MANDYKLDKDDYYDEPLGDYIMPNFILLDPRVNTYDDNDEDTSHPILKVNSDINALDYGGSEEMKPPFNWESIFESPSLVPEGSFSSEGSNCQTLAHLKSAG